MSYAAAFMYGGLISSVRRRAAILTPSAAILICWSNSIANTPKRSHSRPFGLKEALEALLGRPVDLVEAGAVRNPYLKAGIDGSREPVFEA
jgi:hypothetical protein